MKANMNESESTKLFIDISSKLASIDTKMTTLCSTIAAHEQRITNLEQSKNRESDDFKTQLLKLTGKALLVAVITIGSLTGSASMIAKIFAQ